MMVESAYLVVLSRKLAMLITTRYWLIATFRKWIAT
jgi:hypothetical protein